MATCLPRRSRLLCVASGGVSLGAPVVSTVGPNADASGPAGDSASNALAAKTQ
jgi:hypothetical protein